MTSKPFLYIIAVIILTGISFSFRATLPDFSGNWALNENRSELGQAGPRVADTRISIDQKDSLINITRTRAGMQGEEVTTKEILATGRVSEVALGSALKKKSILQWDSDGHGFRINYTVSGDFGQGPFEWKGEENWALSNDGKTITVTGIFKMPQGELNTKAVYDKK